VPAVVATPRGTGRVDALTTWRAWPWSHSGEIARLRGRRAAGAARCGAACGTPTPMSALRATETPTVNHYGMGNDLCWLVSKKQGTKILLPSLKTTRTQTFNSPGFCPKVFNLTHLLPCFAWGEGNVFILWDCTSNHSSPYVSHIFAFVTNISRVTRKVTLHRLTLFPPS